MYKASEITPSAIRIQNGINAFIEMIMDRGYDYVDANLIYQKLRDTKSLKFDYGIGRVSVKHGGLLDKDSLDMALALSKDPEMVGA